MPPVVYSKHTTEEDMRAKYIDPHLREWDEKDLVDRGHSYKPGEIKPEWGSKKFHRVKVRDFPDYTLRLDKDFVVAVIEAKSNFLHYEDGMQQGERYAKDLECQFAYSTNGKAINKEMGTGIKEWDNIKKQYNTRADFPTIEELKERLREDKRYKEKFDLLLKPLVTPVGVNLRYYQKNAVNIAIERINQGEKKILLNLATATGKTKIAYQIARKLWTYYELKDRTKPKILFITDRDRLLTQAYDGEFKPFGEARHRIKGKKETAFDIYFTLYQALDVEKDVGEEKETELYKLYPPDYFQYIIIDECHRGASTQGGSWRGILDYFKDAVNIGMTATPKRDADSKDTYDYFGEPAYVYSRKKAVADGFCAPNFLEQIQLKIDETGYIPEPGELDRKYKKPLEQRVYTAGDFDRVLTHRGRQKKVAEYIIKFLNTPPNTKYDKTILFCRDQQHALEMREWLVNLSGLGNEYCKRITQKEADRKAELANFCNPKEKFPVIAVTSKLMTTGIDAPTCKAIVLDTIINSETELKQIEGRGARVQIDFGKYYFTIIDFRDSTARFDDPDWDGEPLPKHRPKKSKSGKREPTEPKERLVVDGEEVEIMGRSVKVYDPSQPSGHRWLELSEYVGNSVRKLSGDLEKEFRDVWCNMENRKKLVNDLKQRGISIEQIRKDKQLFQADMFDILMNIAYNKRIRSRNNRKFIVKKDKSFFLKYPEKAREVLDVLLEHYAEYGYQELEDRKVLALDKFDKFDGPVNIVENIFGGGDKFDKAVHELVLKIYEK